MRLASRLLLLAALIGVAAPAQAWDQFQIIEWQARNEAQLVTLKRLGITAATVIAKRDDLGNAGGATVRSDACRGIALVHREYRY